MRGSQPADGSAPHALEGASLYAYTGIVLRDNDPASSLPVQLYIDSGTDAALVFRDAVPEWLTPETGSWTIKGLGEAVACSSRVTLPVTVFSVTGGSVGDVHRMDVVAYVIPSPRPVIGGYATDIVLPPVFSHTGPLAPLFAARVAKVPVETYIPIRSATPRDEHSLRLCGLTADDDNDDEFPHEAEQAPCHSPAAFRDLVASTVKAGIAYNHSDSITYSRRPAANPHWPPGNPQAWVHGLPPARPAASTPSSPFPPPAASSLEQRLRFFRDSVPYSPAVEAADRERLIELLCKHQAAFEPLNAKSPAKHVTSIKLKPGAQPIRARCRPVNPRIFDKVAKLIDDALEKGIIRHLRPDEHPVWLTPLVAARKPRTNDYRLCWDFTALNAATDKKHVDLPTVAASLEATAGYDMYTTMDLQQSFHQVGLDTDSQLLCAVTTPWGNFAVTRMAMGLINSPTELQQIVDNIFNDMINTATVSCYIDDILVKTKGNSYREIIDNHLAALDQALGILVANGLLVNLAKSCFMCPSVSYLGNIVSKYQRSIDPARLQGLRELGEVTDLASARTLIGILVHHQNFCPMLQTVLGPLHDYVKQCLVDKANGVRASRPPPAALEAQRAATALVLRDGRLRQPDPNHDFFIATDASLVGAGAVLQQADDAGVLHPVAYASHRFSPVQTRWGVSDREAFGILLAFQRWQHLVRHSRCIVVTDHKDLLSWATSASPRIVRWSNFLNKFDISIAWVPGSTNNVPDILSRLQPGYGDVIGAFFAMDAAAATPGDTVGDAPPGDTVERKALSHSASVALAMLPAPADTETDTNTDTVGDTAVAATPTLGDAVMLAAIAAAQAAPAATDELARAQASGYVKPCLRNGIRLLSVGRGEASPLWIPQHATELQLALLERAHERAGHRHGRTVFNALVDAGVAWVGMGVACDKYAASCRLCHTSRNIVDRFPHGAMGDFNSLVAAPGDLVVGDFLGPFEPVDFEVYPGVFGTARYILVLVDHYSRCTWLHPCPAADTKSAIHALRTHFRLAGPPVAWRSDNSPFGSKEFLAFLKQHHVRADLSMPKHPQSNGVVERRNADISRLQRILTGLGHSWISFLEHSEWVLQTTRSAAHDHTPFQVFYGMAPNTALSRELGAPRLAFSSYYEREAYVRALREAVDVVHERALLKRHRDHEARTIPHNITPGDLVKIWLGEASAKLDLKLDLGRVVERADVNGEAYVVQPLDHSSAGTDALQALTRVIHVDRLQRIPALRDITDADKPAFNLRRVKHGLGTVEAILGFTPATARRHNAHTVNVKWLHVDIDVADRFNLTTILASKLKRNEVLKTYCAEHDIDFSALTNNGPHAALVPLPASVVTAPEFVPATTTAALDSAAPVPAVDVDTDDDSKYLNYFYLPDGELRKRPKLVPIERWNDQQYTLSLRAPATPSIATAPTKSRSARPAQTVRFTEPTTTRTRTGRAVKAPARD